MVHGNLKTIQPSDLIDDITVTNRIQTDTIGCTTIRTKTLYL